MTWTNAFDLGACTVTLVLEGVQQYSGTMAKGDSQSGTSAYYAPWVLAVDASGVVSLTIDDAGWTPASGGVIDITVTPQVARDYPARMTSVAGPGGDAIGAGAANARFSIADAYDATDSINYGLAGLPLPVPSIVDMSALTATRKFVEAYVEFGGT